MIDILTLSDYIHQNLAEKYKSIGGFSALIDDGKERKGIKLGKVAEVRHYKDEGFPLYYAGNTTEFRFPQAWIVPILSAHRALVSYRGDTTKWKCDPFEFFDKHGKKLLATVMETSKSLGRNLNATGKSKPLYGQLYDKVDSLYIRSKEREREAVAA